MNILRNLSSMCITTQTAVCDVTAVEPISIWHCWWRRLLQPASNKSQNWNHRRGGL